MEQYDILIIGSDIPCLVSALFLARKMRNVSILIDEKADNFNPETMDIVDPENNRYRFKYDPEAFLCGLETGGLINRYIKDIGVDRDITGIKIESDIIVCDKDRDFRIRDNQFDRFRVYLVRYYPKQRDQIHRFFRDLERHYDNYVSQQRNMLKNVNYTLTSLMIEWGDYNLADLLNKYFSDPMIVSEFMLNHQLNGLDPHKINSYHFFSQYFLELREGLYYLKTTVAEMRKILLDKLKIINPKMIQKRKVKEYVYEENGKVTHIVDTANRKIEAKHFVVSHKPNEFYRKFFPSFQEEIELVDKFYPDLDSKRRLATMYLALNQKPEQLGINDLTYYFHNDDLEKPNIVKLSNYNLIDPDGMPSKGGGLCLDYAYDDRNAIKEETLLQRLHEVFPKLKKAIVGVRAGLPRQHLAMVSEDEVRKGLSINEQISIEASDHLMFFDNLHVTGTWVRPEAGLFGDIQTGMVLGDKIEESLYYGEDDDSFYYLTNDEIMMMIRHNYGKRTLGNVERHLNFHIGKSTYFIRTKDKNIALHHGEYSDPDLTIYTTNDKLSNLLLKKTTFANVLETNGLKYTGNSDLLYEVISVFNLDDYQEQENRFQPRISIHNLGTKFMFAHLLIFTVVAFLHNYIDLIWLAPFALGLSAFLSVVRIRIYRKISWFEYAWSGIYLVLTVLAIFWQFFNTWRNDDILLGLMGGMFFFTWLINRPIVYQFRKHDFRLDYATSSLFKVVSNGLNFVWALLFLGILAGTYIAGERYVSALYSLVFLGIFLTYYYPLIYVRANIKK
ncbi:MAG: hypothetical protein JXB20_03500 [Bacilli bacterium]|nr:hypothetical protein [Bacilli bacterium]MBN2696644.1 hypothetical protein [Bacilli bacterium]